MSEAHHHPHKTGHSKVDMAVALAALVVSVVSVSIAVHHGHTMEKMVVAATWPYLQLSTSNLDDAGQPTSLRLSAVNSGVGPARVQKVVMRYDGKPVTSSRALLAACCGYPASGAVASAGVLVQSYLAHRVIGAQKQLDYLTVRPGTDDPGLFARFDAARARVQVQACYCSVFDECWIADSVVPEPKPVTSCDLLVGEAYEE